ncbi:MAG TPA: ABC transporter ATP-binding protein [Acetobacteraceae bacterium]|nr:ABC transporter ATP-binding protein [Acetobacteraceae bacterium]
MPTETALAAPPHSAASPAPAPLLEIRNLRVAYHTSRGHLVALPDFSLTIGAGESFGVVGESGCGKSTLVMAIMRYLGRSGVITAGRILFEGRDLVTATEAELTRVRGTRIAIVYQEPDSALNPSMTVGRQLIEVPMLHQGMERRDAFARAEEVLADVHMADPQSILRRYPHQLSGGQKQRVVIAMALLANPSLLLLDEPTTGLDVTVEAAVIDLIDELRRKYRTALLYISHNLGLIARVAERIGVMYAGELVEEARTAALFASPRHPYTRGLLRAIPRMGMSKRDFPLLPIPGTLPAPGAARRGCAFLPRCALALPGTCDVSPVPLAETDAGHRARCLRWAETIPPSPAGLSTAAAGGSGETIIEARSLMRSYRVRRGVIKANDGLDLTACRGEVLGIVGESGSGKSTFARILAGLEAASGGVLRFAGADVARRTVQQRTPAQVAAIQMIFQNPDGTLNPSFPVGWPIARALRKFGIGRRRGEIEERVRRLLEMVQLPASARHSLPRQLSGGQKQRIAIARAFAGRPEVLIADEPTSALDVSVQATVVNLLLSIQAESGTTMVFISHDLSLVRYIADHVVVMYLGRVMEVGPTEALYAPPYHPYTEALLSAVPTPDPEQGGRRIRLSGELPSLTNPPRGCRFASRCPRKLGPICDTEVPPERDAGGGHIISCHIPLHQLAAVAPIPSTTR